MKRLILAVFVAALVLPFLYACESETKVMTHTQAVTRTEPVEVP